MFQKAQRKAVQLRLAVQGPSGSGKTYSALKIAKGLGGKVAVIDTENGSASLYSDDFEFDVVELQPPFTPEKYIEAINAAEKAGYTTLIIDSLTHEWSGEGGVLEQKGNLDLRGGNTYTNWAPMTKKHDQFKNAFLHSPLHIIGTMRSKQDYIIEVNEKGKQAPRKVGLAPIQREGMEYEFTVVFDILMSHEATVSKDRTGLFVDQTFKVNEETGITIKNWLNSVPVAEPVFEAKTDADKEKLSGLIKSLVKNNYHLDEIDREGFVWIWKHVLKMKPLVKDIELQVCHSIESYLNSMNDMTKVPIGEENNTTPSS